MSLFSRRKRAMRSAAPTRGERRAEIDQVRRHLEEFVRTRIGVEAWLEPPTAVLPTTVVLIASSGEWTRRRVLDPKLIHGLAQELAVPVYDVRLLGYPQRMRDWNERVKRGEVPPSG